MRVATFFHSRPKTLRPLRNASCSSRVHRPIVWLLPAWPVEEVAEEVEAGLALAEGGAPACDEVVSFGTRGTPSAEVKDNAAALGATRTTVDGVDKGGDMGAGAGANETAILLDSAGAAASAPAECGEFNLGAAANGIPATFAPAGATGTGGLAEDGNATELGAT
mmetsp:Transcript_187/g.448  ORF Transcript_187/g.448 Transcript_187/m.448 type:complete len:165 (-) Transcript_187:1240-1734(-)